VQLACRSELAEELASLKAKLDSKLEDGDMRLMMDRQKHALQVREPLRVRAKVGVNPNLRFKVRLALTLNVRRQSIHRLGLGLAYPNPNPNPNIPPASLNFRRQSKRLG